MKKKKKQLTLNSDERAVGYENEIEIPTSISFIWKLCYVLLTLFALFCIYQLVTRFVICNEVFPISYYYSNDDNLSMVKMTEIKVENPKVLLINKEHDLPADYVPENLVEPDVPFQAVPGEEKRLMEKEAAEALEDLFEGAKKAGHSLIGISGYRSYTTQNSIYYTNVYRKGLDYTSLYSAKAGQSEHQTGFAIDLSAQSVGCALTSRFADCEEGQWLAKHCHEYGFIVRYPKDKTNITGYAYEPWHIRYVGKKVASIVESKGITLEEYVGATPYEQYYHINRTDNEIAK